MRVLFKNKEGFWQEAETYEARIMNGDAIVMQAWDSSCYGEGFCDTKGFRIDLRVDLPVQDQGGEKPYVNPPGSGRRAH